MEEQPSLWREIGKVAWFAAKVIAALSVVVALFAWLILYHDSTGGYCLGLLRCPECQHVLVGEQILVKPAGFDARRDPEEWGQAVRIWPEPVSELAMSIPEPFAHACWRPVSAFTPPRTLPVWP